jgi:hypothetical protein
MLMGSARQIYGSILLQTAYNKSTQAHRQLIRNLFSKKCAFNNNLQLLEKKFLSQLNTTPKNGILPHFT